mmetsp:Transcript_24086/g.37168  ORF Transcript_24086/g.37168 Transcript_24086/m.37168 type:complete len:411 (-) Transcript_24086:421-1653(-)|eukprot:CAMPEP_0196816490 /NCGR_PEP_ID=MMETSP1362-20130617/55698_1 /TAXON_ID=163516 /ORGANISM="Leptocylindrus danicus, Strain CCMP1856" /LENGTH=410 /DNA_ID=CAMNT_0042193857 /DNA_START=193 /DNA_END=1425 /DNA_ORIENTATION=-
MFRVTRCLLQGRKLAEVSSKNFPAKPFLLHPKSHFQKIQDFFKGASLAVFVAPQEYESLLERRLVRPEIAKFVGTSSPFTLYSDMQALRDQQVAEKYGFELNENFVEGAKVAIQKFYSVNADIYNTIQADRQAEWEKGKDSVAYSGVEDSEGNSDVKRKDFTRRRFFRRQQTPTASRKTTAASSKTGKSSRLPAPSAPQRTRMFSRTRHSKSRRPDRGVKKSSVTSTSANADYMNSDWDDIADSNPDEPAALLRQMTTPWLFKNMQQISDVSRSLQHLGDGDTFFLKTSMGNEQLLDCALVSARVETIPPESVQPEVDDHETSGGNDDSWPVVAQIEVVYDVAQSHTTEVLGDVPNEILDKLGLQVGEPRVETINEVRIAVFEGYLEHPNGDPLRWKLALTRSVNQFIHP